MINKIEKIFFRNGSSAISLMSLFFLLFSAAVFSSCEKVRSLPEMPDFTGRKVVVDKPSVNLMTGETAVINLSLEDGNKFLRKFDYTISDPQLATVTKNSGYSVQVRALRKGTAVIKFVSDEEELSCTVNIDELPPDNITRILAIGNSFSEDALETYFHPIATAAGDSLIVANLYIGGSSLEDHLNNAKGNKAVYSYRKIGKNGVKVTTANVSIEQAINDERWDYISFQQVSQLSGLFDTYQNTLPELFKYVKDRVFYSKTKYVLHQTWAYAQNSTHDGFVNYGKNQNTMYNAILDAVGKASKLVPIDLVVPAGTAIQNGRTSFWGDNFCRDGYHLNLDIGRYLAACTWYEAIFKKSVVGNTFDPQLFSLSPHERALAKDAAHKAVANPNAVTDLTAYKQAPTTGLTVPVFVDVAQTTPVFGWNGLTSPATNTSIAFLRNSNGDLTPVTLTLTEGFNNINLDGEKTTTTILNMPSAVSGSSYFGNTKAAFGGALVKQTVIRLSGFDRSYTYGLCFFGSRGGTTEGRQTKYTAKGQNTVTVNLMTGSNKTNVACAENIIPDSEGNIYVTITAGDLNDNTTGFYYLNAMRIQQQ